jgi:hypothetical protein
MPTPRLALIFAFAALGVACDDEGGGGQPAQPGQQAAQAQPPPAAAGGSNKLVAQVQIEDRVPCKAPSAGAKVCDPNSLKPCGDNTKNYCIATQTQTGIQHLCGPCPERDGIRAAFKESDFTLDGNRDPFASTVLKPEDEAAKAGSAAKPAITEVCKEDKIIASNYSFQDLTLRGIVAQGTRRKVLMMDSGGLGHIISLKDCVGKEKAIVKDIGPEHITFQINSSGSSRYEDRSVQLHANRVALQSNPSTSASEGPGNNAPVVTPQAPPPKERPTVVVPPRTNQPITPYVPPQAPTTLRP